MSYADLLGRRAAKYAALASRSVMTMEWQRFQPDIGNATFCPQDEDRGDSRRLDSAFVKFGAGIKTNRDAVAIGFDDASLIATVRKFDSRLIAMPRYQENIKSVLYRPFDVRRVFYHEDVVASRSLPTMKHFIDGPNIGLLCSSTWTTPARFSVGVSRLMVEMKSGTHDRGTTFFPLYRYERLLDGEVDKIHNFSPEFVREWCAITAMQFVPTGHGDCVRTTGPEDVFSWLFALFYSPEYRRRYRAALAQRFPIVLLTSNPEFLRDLIQVGTELISVHLLESLKCNQRITTFVGRQHPEVEKISWSNDTVWIDRALTTGFRGVSEAVWDFHVGGYPVCEKWLKNRKGRKLTNDEIDFYQRVVVGLNETILIMREVDAVIERHGGWPAAFETAGLSRPG